MIFCALPYTRHNITEAIRQKDISSDLSSDEKSYLDKRLAAGEHIDEAIQKGANLIMVFASIK